MVRQNMKNHSQKKHLKQRLTSRHQEESNTCSGYGQAIVLTALATLVTVCLLALLFPPTIGREISFVAPFQPRPEWYFLWFYQAARYFPGAWAFWGLVLLPGTFFIGVLLLPMLDRNSGRGRVLALALCGLIASAFLALTVLAVLG